MANSSTNITDMDMDSLIHCASFLNLQDISNFAVTCKSLNKVAYSDPIWRSFYRERWPRQAAVSRFSQLSSFRDIYMTRNFELQKFKFMDPYVFHFEFNGKQFENMLINQNEVIFSQGSSIYILNMDSFVKRRNHLTALYDHKARITCMRLYALNETSLFRSETQGNGKVLVTSSHDHSIRLWWKGRCQRCFRGHNGSVTTLSDKLLHEGTGKVFASGSVDGTVRLWSLSSSGKRGQHALRATLYGHGNPLVLMSVAGHKASLLVSMSKDSKVRLWDTTTSSSSSSCCVGMASLPGVPVGMKCHETLLFVAAGSSVAAIDLRTMKKVIGTPSHQSRLYSFQMLPSKSIICTGGINSAMLWDIRKVSESVEAPVSELDGHTGAVNFLYMDHHKVVSGTSEDPYVRVWGSDTGRQTNSLECSPIEGLYSNPGCSAMAVKGCQIATASFNEVQGFLCYRDFSDASRHISSEESKGGSKFWSSSSCTDGDDRL